MKKILIAGKDSYIGNNLCEVFTQFGHETDVLDMREQTWKECDFSRYDSVIVVFGIVHLKKGAVSSELYYKVNSQLVYELACEAKKAGVGQFVFLSSMSVYGSKEMVINRDTPTCPCDDYGKSKLKAEELLTSIADDSFKLAIIRPPMVYGNACKGNYNVISKFVKKFPIFPDYKNKRSLIYIGNLCEFIRITVEQNKSGLFLPQDKELTSTVCLAEEILKANGKKIRKTKIFNPFISLFKKLKINYIIKSFGSYYYDIESDFEHIGKFSFAEAVAASEGIGKK